MNLAEKIGRGARQLFAASAIGAVTVATAPAAELSRFRAALAENTHIIELEQGSRLSEMANGLRGGGFETAQGQWVGFEGWYRTNWTDARATWMTQVTPNFGVLWGASTGERAEKYTISPSLKLGLIFQAPVQKNGVLSFRGSTVVGGRLREKSCVADYGAIAGVQEVNCRLAATPLAPSETLRYNVSEKPFRTALAVQYKKLF